MSASTPATLQQNLLKRFLTPPVFDDEDKTRTARIVHTILVSMTVMIIIFTITTFGQFAGDLNPAGLPIAGRGHQDRRRGLQRHASFPIEAGGPQPVGCGRDGLAAYKVGDGKVHSGLQI